MSDGELRSTWKWTLFRYLIGPVAAVSIMGGLVAWNIAHRDKPWNRSEPISRQFQTHPEGNDWQVYSDEALNSALAAGKVVLVHFVANWSADSMDNRLLLCRLPILQDLVEEGKATLLLADYSDRKPAVAVALRRLDHDEVPVVAVYSPKTSKPTVLIGRVTGRQASDALLEAMP